MLIKMETPPRSKSIDRYLDIDFVIFICSVAVEDDEPDSSEKGFFARFRSKKTKKKEPTKVVSLGSLVSDN